MSGWGEERGDMAPLTALNRTPAAPATAGGHEPATAGPDIRLEGVTKEFGSTVAVDDVTLDVAHGEFFSLLGPSGCGKSTTLSLIGGFESPSAGRVLLGGQDVVHVPAYRRDVNTVFQSYALFPHLSVFENVAFGLRRRGEPKKAIAQRVEELLELVDLPGFGARRPAQLSGGQQQRVALARALVNRPRVLLLDEPMGALDAKLRKQMQVELKRIQSEVGITFLYVTHDQEEAMAMSDRLAVMNVGRIEQIGPPQEVYDHPATEFVAGFLGASNLLPGRIADRARGEIALDGGQTVRVDPARIPAGGGRVKVGVRPEKLRFDSSDLTARDGCNALDTRVQVATYLGVSYQYNLEGPGGATLIAYMQNIDSDPPGPGSAVRVLWRPEHSFVITEERTDDRQDS
jgi:spermidine/putrescine transport system ATP-binding protein